MPQVKRECFMRLILTIAAASLAIATAGCQKPAENNADATAANDLTVNDGMANDAMAGDTGNAMAVAPQAANDFASTIAGSDMFEIASGKLAQTMATNAALKSFGTMLVTDHSKSSSELKTAAAGATPPVTLPTALPAELQAKLDALKAAKGAAFDTLFLEQQKDGHTKALDALKSYASSGDTASLKTFAAKAIPVVQGHLDKLNAM
jgi:putative membrane protein